jgi:cyclohexadienyl dehydratase
MLARAFVRRWAGGAIFGVQSRADVALDSCRRELCGEQGELPTPKNHEWIHMNLHDNRPSGVPLRWVGSAAWLWPVVAVLVLSVGGLLRGAAPRFTTPEELVERVVDLVDRRLAVMPEVAAWKWARQQPILDEAREREVLARWEAEAAAVGLERVAAREFLAVQIEMARAVQQRLLATWQAGAKPTPGRDLATELRPILDDLARELLPALYLAGPLWVPADPAAVAVRWQRLRRHAGVTEAMLVTLDRAAGGARLTAPPTWAILRRVGVVRVGTTGDYAPFSSDAGGSLRGLDLEIAAGLAKEWAVRPVYVRTTWPTLMADLAARRFDFAAAGITVTAERSRVADFSVAYHRDGKTAIARRQEAARFATLAQIDQDGVRVIVNPGGTNERFVRERLRRATILVHPDNRTVFAEIVAGRADVMFTDGVEVQLQSRRHPELAGTLAAPLTQAGKAILLPRDSALKERVDAWLAPRVAAGVIAAELERALEAAR